MTHAINSNTSLLSFDCITRKHTQMRKSPRGEKDSGKEMRRQKGKKIRKWKNQNQLIKKIEEKLETILKEIFKNWKNKNTIKYIYIKLEKKLKN